MVAPPGVGISADAGFTVELATGDSLGATPLAAAGSEWKKRLALNTAR
jgi:hypothetical protein